jgi:GNAT superfamily N-acetyltransferase
MLSTVRIRAVGAGDEKALATFLASLSLDSGSLRSLAVAMDPAPAVAWAGASNPDCGRVVATTADGRIVGHAMLARLYGARAEVTLDVAEDHRRGALAGELIDRLAEVARTMGIRAFIAAALPENADMLAVLGERFPMRERRDGGVVEVTFAIDGGGPVLQPVAGT